MVNTTLFEEPLLKDPEEEVTIAMGLVYGPLVIKKVLDLLRDSTLFQVVATVTPYPFIRSFLFFFLFFPFTYGFLPFTFGLLCR